jgi:hypothetical protein
MALTTTQQTNGWLKFMEYLARVAPGAAATWDVPGLVAALNATDAWVTANQSSYLAALQANAPAFAANSTTQQKSLIFVVDLLLRSGLL